MIPTDMKQNRTDVVDAAKRLLKQISPISLREFVVALSSGYVTRQHASEWSHLLESSQSFRSFDGSCSIGGLPVKCLLGSKTFRSIPHPRVPGWSSCLEWVESGQAAQDRLDRFIYFGTDLASVTAARDADELGDHERFGELLGYPACCRDFFTAHWPAVAGVSCDLLPKSCARTAGNSDSRTNIATQYFGWSPISFFPCSFRCCAAASVGQRAIELSDCVDPIGLGRRLRWYMSCSVFYSADHGVFLLPEASLRDGVLTFDRKRVEGRGRADVLKAIRRSSRLVVESTSSVRVESELAPLVFEGTQVAICVF